MSLQSFDNAPMSSSLSLTKTKIKTTTSPLTSTTTAGTTASMTHHQKKRNNNNKKVSIPPSWKKKIFFSTTTRFPSFISKIVLCCIIVLVGIHFLIMVSFEMKTKTTMTIENQIILSLSSFMVSWSALQDHYFPSTNHSTTTISNSIQNDKTQQTTVISSSTLNQSTTNNNNNNTSKNKFNGKMNQWSNNVSQSVLTTTSDNTISFFDSYNWNESTEFNYKKIITTPSNTTHASFFCGKYASIRQELDYSYHAIYSCNRQKQQDEMIDIILAKSFQNKDIPTKYNNQTTCLNNNKNDNKEVTPSLELWDHTNNNNTLDDKLLSSSSLSQSQSRPPIWIIFTAGVMGAGKTHTMKRLQKQGKLTLPNDYTCWIDFDEFRSLLPEYPIYVQHNANRAGEWTRKEVGYLSELATLIALQQNHWNVIVDGTLRDATWYSTYFIKLQTLISNLQIAIIHVTASKDVILQRLQTRAQETGRVVPESVLLQSMEQVPKSVNILKSKVDLFIELQNSDSSDTAEIITSNMTWDFFCQIFWSKNKEY